MKNSLLRQKVCCDVTRVFREHRPPSSNRAPRRCPRDVPTPKRRWIRKTFWSLPAASGTSARARCYGPDPAGARWRRRPRLPAGTSRGLCRPRSSAGRSTSRTRGAPRDGRGTIGTPSREEARYPKRRARSSRSWRYARWPASPRSPRSCSRARCAARTRRRVGSSCSTPDRAARACTCSSWMCRRAGTACPPSARTTRRRAARAPASPRSRTRTTTTTTRE